MTYPMHPKMAEATRLVTEGKLAESTALIQAVLAGQHPANTGFVASPSVIDLKSVHEPAAPSQRAEIRTPARTGLGETLRRLAAKLKFLDREGEADPSVPPIVPVPDGASFKTHSYTNAAGTRSYKLYTPSNRPSKNLPLVVMLHGCTQSPDDFAAGTRMNMLAEERGFYVAYPAQSASANAKKCWNWFEPSHQQRDKGEPSILAGITRDILANHDVDPNRIFIAGMSAGGASALIMGLAYPDLYAAIGIHSGLPHGSAHNVATAFAAMRKGTHGGTRQTEPIPTIVFHGDSDRTVDPRNSDAIIAQTGGSTGSLRAVVRRGQQNGGHAYTHIVRANQSGRVVSEQWIIHGAGHAWSGGCASGTYTDVRGPDATREMFRFFDQVKRS